MEVLDRLSTAIIHGSQQIFKNNIVIGYGKNLYEITVLTLLGAGVHPLGLTPAKITVHPKNTGLTPKVLG